MNEPKIIIFDLETLPNLKEALKVWPKLSDYPGLTLKATITSIICAGWKILGDKKVHCINAWDFKAWGTDVNNDYDLCVAMSKVLEDADCVVTHNGKGFDFKYFQTRLLINRLPLLPKIHHVDTKNIAKSNLFLFNNRLQTLAEFLVNESKLQHSGWDMWVQVHGRDPKAMNLMEKYCKQDVNVLEKVLQVLRPLVKLPNYNAYLPGQTFVCPNCQSTRIQKRGTRMVGLSIYTRYWCRDCDSWSRTDSSDKNPRHI